MDMRAVLALALPLMLNSAVQLVLNRTDTWFVGRLSTEAMAAMGAVHFLAIVFLLAIGGVGLATQMFVAQAYGARLSRRAARSVWMGLWATVLFSPLFVLLAYSGPMLLTPFGLAPEIADRAAHLGCGGQIHHAPHLCGNHHRWAGLFRHAPGISGDPLAILAFQYFYSRKTEYYCKSFKGLLAY